ncbi:kinesin motor domain-containing protein [Ditylenchus destructor]|uniref:Kinesin motor domain-containing protein n=1 Tax=Ditylenchus destructor TaxID=166010 RepID=A0AAD4NFY5_9BILA|nr:kinesin motor domain-containing protein [Ditylenchus destructor]
MESLFLSQIFILSQDSKQTIDCLKPDMSEETTIDDRDFTSEGSENSTEVSNLKVYLRIRPNDEQERCQFINISSNETNLTFVGDGNKPDLNFTCDYIFNTNASQETVYDKIAPNLLSSFMGGQDVCIFAYGQTGSGKTHSILGNSRDRGLLPRFSKALLQDINSDFSNMTTTIEVSFYEVYNEKVYDLLSENRHMVRIRGTEKIYLEDLTILPVQSMTDFKKAINAGLKKRCTGSTLLNDVSSRSHAIFHIKLNRSQTEVLNEKQRICTVISDCYFVDLAGSEKASAETAAINCSLLALQKIIESKALNTAAYVNYRESVLTRLLKDCFEGNSKIALLATISSNISDRHVTLQTLRFSMNASKLQLFTRKNVASFVEIKQKMEEENHEVNNRDFNQWQKEMSSVLLMPVSRKRLFGKPPSLQLNGPDDVELIPQLREYYTGRQIKHREYISNLKTVAELFEAKQIQILYRNDLSQGKVKELEQCVKETNSYNALLKLNSNRYLREKNALKQRILRYEKAEENSRREVEENRIREEEHRAALEHQSAKLQKVAQIFESPLPRTQPISKITNPSCKPITGNLSGEGIKSKRDCFKHPGATAISVLASSGIGTMTDVRSGFSTNRTSIRHIPVRRSRSLGGNFYQPFKRIAAYFESGGNVKPNDPDCK